VEIAKGELANALSFYNKVIEQNPFSIDGYSERAKLKMQMDDQQGAAEDLAKLKDINPDSMEENLEEKMNEAYKNANPYGF
jgi:tetratricopeptide (TPR) repeat protein